MHAQMPLEALRMAIRSRKLEAGWIHHSDRGCQYASTAFRDLVTQSGGRSSFSSPASPSENAFAESFFARFKDEVVRIDEFESLEQIEKSVCEYVDFYNKSRPHSSLGYHSPITL